MEICPDLVVNMELNGDARQAMTTINHKLSQLPESRTQPCVFKVHKPLRNINPKAYEPEILAIGPYHHGKDDLEMMEDQKVRYLELLLQRKDENVERYISAVSQLEHKARNCYAEPISFNKAELIEMLVMDGCFIIELILKLSMEGSTRDNDPIFETKWIMLSLKRDLILFENQIPFFVLCKLCDLIVGPNQHNRFMNMFLNFFKGPFHLEGKRSRTNRSPQEVKHLLDLVHGNWRPSDDVYINVNAYPLKREQIWIHSATELSNSNVKFQKSESGSPFEVGFNDSIIQMPPLTIFDRTEGVFRNLIAYEEHFSKDKQTFITDYVRLMGCLINSSKDVQILSRCGIIDNRLGDGEVAANICLMGLLAQLPTANIFSMLKPLVTLIPTTRSVGIERGPS